MKSTFAATLVSIALAASLVPCAAFAQERPNLVAEGTTPASALAQGPAPVPGAALGVQVAKSSYVKSKNKQSASGTPYSLAKASGRTFKVSGGKLTVSEGGKKRTLTKGAYSGFVTNGRYVFYSKVGKQVGEAPFYARRHTVYRLDVDTGAKKRVGSGINWVPFACNGKYLYCGAFGSSYYESSLYAVNLGTWKKRCAGKGVVGGDGVALSGGRVVTSDWIGGVGYKVFSFKQDGTGKKVIAKDVWGHKVKSGKLTYLTGTWKIPQKCRAYRCTVAGKNRKALSGWTTDVSGLYSKYIG